MLRVSEGQSVFHLLPGGLGLWNKEQEQQRICANSSFTGAAAQWAELKRDEHGEGRSAARAELGDSTFPRERKIKSWNWALNVKPCRKSWTFNYSHEATWVTSLMPLHVFQWWNEEWLAFIPIIQKYFIGWPPPPKPLRHTTLNWRRLRSWENLLKLIMFTMFTASPTFTHPAAESQVCRYVIRSQRLDCIPNGAVPHLNEAHSRLSISVNHPMIRDCHQLRLFILTIGLCQHDSLLH